ncbi:MAG TPA: phosphohydrolase [Peptococcaceae bacterium]|nr:MAG: Metal dependent phosphohydrolase [Clostridia bacterium 41_269]HBT20298.1 phosphohydrolase [Peptococcaceae bacterium]
MKKGKRGPGAKKLLLRGQNIFSTRRLIWGVIFFIATTLILSTSFLPERINVKVGDVSNRQIKAPNEVVYVSEVLTEKARQEAASQVEPIFKIDQTVVAEIEKNISGFFNTIRTIREDDDLSKNEKIAALQKKLNFDLPQSAWESVIGGDVLSLNTCENVIKSVVNEHMGKGVQLEALDTAREEILKGILASDIPQSLKPLAEEVVEKMELKPNLILDVEGTEQKKKEAMEKVEPVRVTIRKDEKILGDGEVVTEEKIEALEHLGLLRTRNLYLSLLGLSGFVLVSYVLLMLYLYIYNKNIFEDEKKLLLLGILVNVGLLIDKGIISIRLSDNAEIASLVGFMVPTAAVSMLTAVLLDRKLAVFITMILSIFVGMLMGNQLHFMSVSFISGVVGIYSVSDISERTDLTRASIYISLASLAAVIAVIFIRTNSLNLAALGAAVGLINGILSSVLTIGTLPFLESAFGITTPVKLLELSNPNQPLLKRLMLEAPGTYHHSIMVANLAERAADATGADPLLTRVGAYYHDIGKLKRPYFFIENQVANENPHNKLSPNLSTLVITSHVRDGVELAEENNLPQEVIDIIEQHHGTCLVSYFYHKALESENCEHVNEIDFRYEGPKPRTKEAAIVMLADSVEAAVRSLPSTAHGKLEGCVKRIIRDRLEDGQLEESELTFRELEIITKVFVRVLSGIFHSRIEYPENLLQEIEGRKGNGDHGK